MNRLTPASSLGIPKSLPDDILKVRVHGGMRAQAAAKEKPRRSGAPVPLLVPPAIHAAQHARAGRESALPSRPTLPPAAPTILHPQDSAIFIASR